MENNFAFCEHAETQTQTSVAICKLCKICVCEGCLSAHLSHIEHINYHEAVFKQALVEFDKIQNLSINFSNVLSKTHLHPTEDELKADITSRVNQVFDQLIQKILMQNQQVLDQLLSSENGIIAKFRQDREKVFQIQNSLEEFLIQINQIFEKVKESLQSRNFLKNYFLVSSEKISDSNNRLKIFSPINSKVLKIGGI